MLEISISRKQSQEFARAIFEEIHAYVQNHLQAYEEFQRMELNSKIKGDNHYEN